MRAMLVHMIVPAAAILAMLVLVLVAVRVLGIDERARQLPLDSRGLLARSAGVLDGQCHDLGGVGKDDDDAVEAHSRRYEPLQENVEPYPRTADLLRACAERGLAVVLATSGKAADLDWMQPAIGAEDAVTGATTSEDVDEGKPEPDLLTTAMRDHGLDPERTVAVGDTVWDVEAARKAGIPCIALTCGGIGAGELTDAGADAVYDDPADLLDHLDDSPLGRITTR